MKYLYKSQYILAVLFLSFGISTNISAAITDILLTPSSIQENAPIGSTVGILTTIDDTGPVIGTYSLVGGFGSSDNSSFTVSGQEIQSNEVFNYESGPVSFSIRVHTEVGVESFEKVITITLLDENEIPTISGISATPYSYTEGQAGLQLASSLAVADPDDVLTSASVYFGSILPGDSLYALSSLVPSDFDHVNKRLEISGTATPSVYQTVLRSVRYINISENPGNTDRQVNFIVNDGTNTSTPVYRTIQMTPVNDLPVLDGVPASVLPFTEGSPGLIFAPAITVTDLDDINLDSANVYFTSGYVSTEDSLYLVDPLFTITYKVSTGILRIKGSATIEQYQEALRNVRYMNTNEANPTVLPNRIISIRVHDGNNFSNIETRTISITTENDPPVASDAAILGTPSPVFYTRELLTADYVYTDPESNPENITGSGTSFRWHTATSASGTGIAVIGGAVSDTFTTRFADGGKWINMVVTPREQSGLWGDDDTSSWHYVNAAPVMQNFTIINQKHPGAFAVDETVKADYTYFDLELNAAGTNEYQWYSSQTASWSDAQVISGATLDSFKITIAQNTRSIALQSYPHALSGTPRGDRTRSPWFSVGTKPTAVISGNDTICRNAEVRRLRVTLTGTNPPWTIRYLKNGTTDTLDVGGIAASPYNLIVPDSGTYKLVNVSDQRYDFGTVSGTGIIKYFTLPTATLPSAQVGICPGDVGPFSYPIVLTGDEPWSVSIQEEGADSFMISSIHVTPYNRPIVLADTGTYTLLHVWDENCMAAGSGSTEVLKKTAPSAVMSGDTAICTGGTAHIQVELSGDGPWTFYYRRNTGSEIPVTVNMNLSQYIYSLSVTQAGTYTLTRIVDQVEEGCASGSAVITTHLAPTAAFTEGTSTCEHASNRLRLTLGGVAPWTVSYRYESDAPVSVSDIPTSPVNIPVSSTGTYSLVSVTDLYCTSVENDVTEIIPAPAVNLSGIQTYYDVDADPVPVTVSPTGGDFDDSDSPLAIVWYASVSQWKFYPDIARAVYGSPFWVVYSYQDPGTTCVGKDSIQTFILTESAEIQVEDYKEMYCSNDENILLRGVNLRNATGTFTISTPGTGLLAAGADSAYLLPSVIQSGYRTVTYSVMIDGSLKTAQKTFNFNHVNSDFTWDNECFNGQSLINFEQLAESSQDTITSYQWNFYFENDTITKFTPLTNYTFDELQTYWIDLIATAQHISTSDTTYCSDTTRRELILKPTYTVNGTPFIEDFQDGANLWISSPVEKEQNNSWTYGTPEGSVFAAGASEKAWYTNIDNLNLSESSYVISPCFDFTGSRRPMIKMDIWRGFNTNGLHRDGAALQYTTDNGESWNTVGTVGDGIRWYNFYNVLGMPGGQGLGWDETHDNGWVEARHKLDPLNNLQNVRFRLAYGASVQSGVTSNGIAFDNFWIGERSKTVLLEHFTNAGDPDSRIANENLNAIINTPENLDDIIDLQFHSDSPGNDTFNIINPEPPYSRDFYYGIPSIPYSIIDGGRGNQGAYLIDYSTNESLVQNDLTLAALADNIFTIDMQTNLSGNAIDIDIDLKANTPVEQSSLTLHTVVIEDLITGVTGDNGETSFESVVKDMLPVGGTAFNQTWATGDMEEISLHYDFKDVFDEQQIRIVAFIQDYETGEVFQAVRMNPNVHVGIDPVESDEQTINVFPNPARDIVNIEFLDLNASAARIEVISSNGSLVYSSAVPGGETIVQLSTKNLSPGIYILKVVGKNRQLGIEKLIVTGNN